MKKWGFCCVVLGVCFLVAMTLGAAVRSDRELWTHHFDLPCDKCHVSGAQEEIQGQLTNAWALKNDINKSCTTSSCHDFDPMLSHPVGIKPNGPIPEDLPLDEHSNITCLTCHKESGVVNDHDYSDIEGENKYLLRRPLSEQLCSSCHINSNSISNEHWLFSTRAHLQVSDDDSFASERLNVSFERIDRESRNCLTCHDDITTSISSDITSFGGESIGYDQMPNHPIGVDYMSAANQKAAYNTNFTGDSSRIRLFDGKVGCGSCHSLYAQTENHLVADDQDSTLCRKCHDL
jgi:predicted CXXCH cytochrome family protein